MRHELKADPIPFESTAANLKRVEIRTNDRNFAVGDELLIKQTKHSARDMGKDAALIYTGKESRRIVTHIQRGYGLPDDLVALSIRPLTNAEKLTWNDAK